MKKTNYTFKHISQCANFVKHIYIFILTSPQPGPLSRLNKRPHEAQLCDSS